MRVLFVTQLFDPTHGGGETIFYLVAKEFAKRGHGVHVLCQRVKGCNFSINPLSNLKIHNVHPIIDYKGGLPYSIHKGAIYFFNSIRSGLKIIKSEGIDIIHANTYVPVFVGVVLSKLTHRPLVLTIHDVALTNGLSFWERWMNQFGASFLHAFIGYITEFLTVKAPANAIATVSETSRDDIFLVRRNSFVFVIPNGLDLESYMSDFSSIQYGDEIVFIGRSVYYKNLEVVLKALRDIIQDHPNVKLIVIGHGPMLSTWRELSIRYGVDKNVVFTGHISHEEKISILAGARALVLPSLWEGFGIVLLEAWALKKPVIVSKVPPLTNIVEHGKDGFHAHPFNPKEWAEFLETLLSNGALAKKMGEAGYSKLTSKFALQATVQKLEDLYLQIIRRRNGVAISSKN